MEDNEKFAGKIKNLGIVIISASLFIFYVLTEYFYYFNLKDNPSINETGNPAMFIVPVIFVALYLLFYILNLFKFNIVKAYKTMNIISSGTVFFFGPAVIINLISASDKLVFNTDNISFFVTVSLTLLGFGLTVVAILFQSIQKTIQKNIEENKLDNGLFDLLIPYFLFFAMALIFSIASLINIQDSGTIFYKVIIYRAFFYSSAQIMMMVIILIVSFVQLMIDKIK